MQTLLYALSLWSVVLAYQQHFPRSENRLLPDFNDPGLTETVWAEAGGEAALPLPISTHHRINMILWFKDSTGIPFYSVDARGGELSKASHTFITDDLGARSFFVTEPRALLRVTKVSAKDQGLYRARIDYVDSPTRNYRHNLTLVVPPSDIQILDSDGREIRGDAGPYLEGYDILLTCIVTGGDPKPRVSWWLEDEEIDAISESSSSGTVANKLHLMSVSRPLHDTRLSCSAKSSLNSTPTLLPLTLKLYLKPVTVKIVWSGEGLVAGKSKQLLCESAGSAPAANITWLIDGQPIRLAATMVGSSKNKTTSMLSLRPSSEEDGKELSCTAHNPMFPGVQLTDSIRLKVTYAPIAYVRIDHEFRAQRPLKEGDNVTLLCDIRANPPPDYILWYHGSELISKNETGSRLLLASIKPSSGGHYSCFVRNSQGAVTSAPYNLHVNYAPVCAEGWQYKEAGAAAGQEVVAECRVDASPAKDLRFSWTLSKSRQVVSLSPGQISSEGTVSHLRFKPSSDTELGTLSCWASNSVGKQMSPCVLRLFPARVPEKPQECRVVNRSGDGLEVRCDAGRDGGIGQHFVAEVRSWPTQTPGALSDQAMPLVTLLSPYPTFRLTGLVPDTAYQLTLYAKNSVGLSQPPVVLSALTLPSRALQVVSEKVSEEVSVEESYDLWWWMGGVLGLTALVSLMIIVIWSKSKNEIPRDMPLNNMAHNPRA